MFTGRIWPNQEGTSYLSATPSVCNAGVLVYIFSICPILTCPSFFPFLPSVICRGKQKKKNTKCRLHSETRPFCVDPPHPLTRTAFSTFSAHPMTSSSPGSRRAASTSQSSSSTATTRSSSAPVACPPRSWCPVSVAWPTTIALTLTLPISHGWSRPPSTGPRIPHRSPTKTHVPLLNPVPRHNLSALPPAPSSRPLFRGYPSPAPTEAVARTSRTCPALGLDRT